MRIRPLTEDDVPAAVPVVASALPIPGELPGPRRAWIERRTLHLLRSDPAGCWAADDDGEVAGVALALVRDGIWGLSMLAVAPDRHARGTGSALLRAALGTADATRAGIIASSSDPKAMRLYARAGFALRPAIGFGGIPDPSALPAGLTARPSDDLEAASAISGAVRGGRYAPDDLALLVGRDGFGLLLVPGRGFAVHDDDGSPAVLCATDDEAAADLLWSCLAAGPRGASVHVDFITAGPGLGDPHGARGGAGPHPRRTGLHPG
jgi:ribosomal protein S18 acetylase RimI-like enzyme